MTAEPIPTNVVPLRRPAGISAPYTAHSFPYHLRDLEWEQGQHVLVAAPTGAGKTTLVAPLVRKRAAVVVLVSKPRDNTIRDVFPRERGWERIEEWPPPAGARRVLLWPRMGKNLIETLPRQRDAFSKCLNAIAREGRWCVVIDESHYTCDPAYLGLGKEVAILHHMGRSSGVSMVDLTQRPSWIPKILYSSVSHAYIGRTRDRDDLRRLSDLGGIDSREVASQVSALPSRYDYLYVNPHGDAVPRVINRRR